MIEFVQEKIKENKTVDINFLRMCFFSSSVHQELINIHVTAENDMNLKHGSYILYLLYFNAGACTMN